MRSTAKHTIQNIAKFMSKIFYDHLIILEEVEIELDNLQLDKDERRELEHLIEETIHHRMVGKILTKLPKPHHEEFLKKFASAPHDPSLIHYLNHKIKESVEKHIAKEIESLKKELLTELKGQKK